MKRSLVLGILIAVGAVSIVVAAQQQALGDDEYQHQPGGAEQLEVDPGFGREVIGDIEVDGAHCREEGGPAQVQIPPDRGRKGELFFHHGADHISAKQQIRTKQDGTKKPV